MAGNVAGLESDVQVLAGDALAPPLRAGVADVVLVDAPCSGLGVLRRRPDARWRVDSAEVDRLAELQVAMLSAAAPLVAVGGRLVYSVCTLTTAETTGVVEQATPSLDGFDVIPVDVDGWRRWGTGRWCCHRIAAPTGWRCSVGVGCAETEGWFVWDR